MSLMTFFEGSRFGTGNLLTVRRSTEGADVKLILDYEYIWDGVHVIGTYAGTRIAGGAWSGKWNDRAAIPPFPCSGDAVLLESSVGGRRLLAGEWCLTTPTQKKAAWHPWTLILDG